MTDRHAIGPTGEPLPVVLLPGMMCDARLFTPQVTMLSLACSVMVSPLTGGSTVQKLAERVLADAPPRFVLGGHGMGGVVAMEVARRAADRVAGLVLISTSPLPEAPGRAAEREPQIIAARTGSLERVLRDAIKPTDLAPTPRRDAVLEVMVDMGLALGAEVFVDQSRALQRRPDQQSTLRRLSCPSLVLCGAEDQITPVGVHELMSGLLRDAHLRVISGAGHLPTLEQPESVTAAIATFLQEI